MLQRKQKFARRHILRPVAAIFLVFLIFQFFSIGQAQAASQLVKPGLDFLRTFEEIPAACDPAGNYFSDDPGDSLKNETALPEIKNSGIPEKIGKDSPEPKPGPKLKAKGTTSNFSGIGRPAEIMAKTDIFNGKPTCAAKNDHPSKSRKNPSGHIDGECCLDPDEVPNSLCYYSPEKYGYLVQKYLASQKK